MLTNSWLKIERYFFYLFLIAVPFQARKMLWLWGGTFNEWNAAFIYGTDGLILILWLFWIKRQFWQKGENLSGQSTAGEKTSHLSHLFLFVFLGISALSLFVASNRSLGLYHWLKTLEMAGLYFYVRQSLGTVFTYAQGLTTVIVSGFLQSIVAVLQVISQRSLGLFWLGESVLRINFNGVAVVLAEGKKFLRAYGTTPHPNVLAAWLFLAVFAFYFWYLYQKKERPWWSLLLIYAPLLFAFFLTFSRVAIGLWFLGITARLMAVLLKRGHYHLSAIFKKRVKALSLVTGALMVIFASLFWPQVWSRMHLSLEEQAVTQRLFYNQLASATTREHPWLGVGPGQFVWEMYKKNSAYPSYLYQPVHNIYLLVSSETGIMGIVALAGFIIGLFYRFAQGTRLTEIFQLSLFVLSSSVLIMGFFDHFLWTIQQGEIILWLILGLIGGFPLKRISPVKI